MGGAFVASLARASFGGLPLLYSPNHVVWVFCEPRVEEVLGNAHQQITIE
jgi:hypothetical protein